MACQTIIYRQGSVNVQVTPVTIVSYTVPYGQRVTLFEVATYAPDPTTFSFYAWKLRVNSVAVEPMSLQRDAIGSQEQLMSIGSEPRAYGGDIVSITGERVVGLSSTDFVLGAIMRLTVENS